MSQHRATPRRIGLLGPFAELPGELFDVVAEAPDPAVAWQVVTEASDSHAPEDLLRTGDHGVLLAGARRLLRWRPDVIMWACTSGSFIRGRDHAISQSKRLAEECRVPVSSTSLAFIEALAVLGIADVDVLSPYPPTTTEAFVSFLREWQIRVGTVVHLDHPSGRSSAAIELSDVAPHLSSSQPSHVLLIPDTAVWGFELLARIGQGALRPSVLVANQVTLWQAFRLAGVSTELPRFGLLQGKD